jgi:hypothetical protein
LLSDFLIGSLAGIEILWADTCLNKVLLRQTHADKTFKATLLIVHNQKTGDNRWCARIANKPQFIV